VARATLEQKRKEGAQHRQYHPYGAAWDLKESRDPEVLLSGPAGTGKSRAALEKLHWLLGRRYPRSRGLIIRKTRESVSESALQTFEDHVLGPGHPLAGTRQRNIRQSYRYPNGSMLNVGGIDKSTKIMSTEYDFIYVQEATELTAEDWESLTTRLRNGMADYQQIMADCNPGPPTHWLKQRCDRGDCRMIAAQHTDNPRLWNQIEEHWTPYGELYIARLDRLTGVRKDRLRYGRWVAAEGAVYEFQRGVHTLPSDYPIPREWRRIRVIDFGFMHPFVCQWWAIDPDGRAYRYREIYMSQRLVSDHAKLIVALSEGESIETTICDWDREGRETLEAEGIPNIPADKRIEIGIQKVQGRLRVAGDKRPRLFFLDYALVEKDDELEKKNHPWETTQEFDLYVYPQGREGRPVREVPIKENDHGMDTTRYLCNYLDGDAQSIDPLDEDIADALQDFVGL